jgi:hypothetical protein
MFIILIPEHYFGDNDLYSTFMDIQIAYLFYTFSGMSAGREKGAKK